MKQLRGKRTALAEVQVIAWQVESVAQITCQFQFKLTVNIQVIQVIAWQVDSPNIGISIDHCQHLCLR